MALVGGSPRQGSVGRAILQNILKAKFKGEFGLVNPRYAEIDGVAAVGSLDKLPFVLELVVITRQQPQSLASSMRQESGARRALKLSAPGLGMARVLADAAERVAQNMGCGYRARFLASCCPAQASMLVSQRTWRIREIWR